MKNKMKSAYRLFKRRNRPTYYIENTDTGEQKSLGTADKQEARRLFNAHLEAKRASELNLQLGSVYIASADPKMAKRTWQHAIDEMCSHGQPVSQLRYAREFKSRAYDIIRDKPIIRTTSEDLGACCLKFPKRRCASLSHSPANE